MDKGKKYYDNGNLMYEGEFKGDKFWGKGKLYNEQGILVHEGEFKNGEFKNENKE